MQDKILTFSTDQAITTDAVSEFVLSRGSDAAAMRSVLASSGNLVLKILCTTDFAGLDSGMRVEFRWDTEAGLASGNQIVQAVSPIILPANLVQYRLHQVRLNPKYIGSGYDFCGVYYDVVSEAGSAGAVTTWLADGAESTDTEDS